MLYNANNAPCTRSLIAALGYNQGYNCSVPHVPFRNRNFQEVMQQNLAAELIVSLVQCIPLVRSTDVRTYVRPIFDGTEWICNK